MKHAFEHRPALQRYASSDSLPNDNNPVESAIRSIAIGKKNCLVVDAERSGRRAPRSSACLPLPNSTDSIQHAGCLTPSRSSRLAPTAGWIHCYRSRPWRVPTVHHRARIKQDTLAPRLRLQVHQHDSGLPVLEHREK
ncbi:transposase [Janthinobacterium sp. SUN118]|uniref:IS66 family transposase n=1 Tax=Janthinobacterium sp. SUN118 TaxID=3004100 RepID=UPI0025B169EC|nr:transposase [Janthinobacterium sp. SUN118]MDN2709861.1 transposase [Janthinobacterium sp. SUN118]